MIKINLIQANSHLLCRVIWLNYVLRVLIAGLFIFSGIVKLNPIEPFELTLVDVGMADWSFAPILARLLIGFELFLGASILINTKYLNLLLKATLILTGFFTLYLLLLMAFRGNEVNCGCFGALIYVTPLQSIIKNVVLAGVILAALKTHKDFNRKLNWLFIGLLAVGLTAPFVVNTVDIGSLKEPNKDFPQPFRTELIDSSYLNELNIDFAEGEYLLAFLSLECSHCKTTAQKLAIISKKYKIPPIKVFFLGAEKQVTGFNQESNSSFEYVMFNNSNMFKITKGKFPQVFYVKDGQTVQQWTGGDLSYRELENLQKTLHAY